MIEQFVIQAGRGSGKTYQMMTEIHERIIAGERADILVIFPTMDSLGWWRDMWNGRFPHLPMPEYTSFNAMDRVRGKRIKHVYVDDISLQPDGIYTEKLTWLWPCFQGDDCTITFTSRTDPESWISHRDPPPPTRKDIIEREKARVMTAITDAYHISRMIQRINRAEG